MKGLLSWIKITSVVFLGSTSLTKDAVIKENEVIIKEKDFHINRLKTDLVTSHKIIKELTLTHTHKDSIIEDFKSFNSKLLSQKDSTEQVINFWKTKAITLQNKELKTVEIQVIDKKYKAIATGRGKYYDSLHLLRIPTKYVPDSTFSDSLDYPYVIERGKVKIMVGEK